MSRIGEKFMNYQQKENKPAVVGIDYPCMDYIISTDRLPGTNDEIDIDQESWQGGGMVPTALVALGRLGAVSGLIGVVGSDIYGRFCREDLRKHQVDVSRLIVDEGQTTDFCISVAEKITQGRSFITRWGSIRRLTEADLDKEYIAGAEYLHLCMEMNEINAAAARIAKSAGTKVVLDADHDSELTERNLGLVDVLIASEKYYRHRFPAGSEEENCRTVLEKGPSVVVFTLGSKGCIGMSEEGFFRLDAFHPGPIVDTTGAGDVFHGAFIRAMLDEKTPEECARFASAAAAIKCLRLGGRAGIPDLKTTVEFLETGIVGSCDFEERERYYRYGLDSLLETGKKEEKWQ